MKIICTVFLLLFSTLALSNTVVAPNRSFETRPLISVISGRAIARAIVGDECGDFSHATGLNGRFRYHEYTNADGISGHVICVESEMAPLYLQLVPGRIEFEDYTTANDSTPESNRGGLYRDDFGVDIQNLTGDTGGFNVGWTQAGEWLEYEVVVNDTALYQVTARYARVEQPNAPVNLSFSVDGVQVYVSSGIIPSTGAWDVWAIEDAGLIFLPAGRYTLRLDIDNGAINLDWFELTPVRWVTIEVMGIS